MINTIIRFLERRGFIVTTPEDLAVALHAADNEGRIGAFGFSRCDHVREAEEVALYLRSEPV